MIKDEIIEKNVEYENKGIVIVKDEMEEHLK
jgi:hypothetical protein